MRLTEHWRLKTNRYQLIGNRDNASQTVHFPPRPTESRELPIYEFAFEASPVPVTEIKPSVGAAAGA